jgi:undecaprenyl-diphosphatase
MEFVQAFDEGALFWCENHHSTVGNTVMEFVTRLGNTWFVIGVIALGVILFALAGRRRTASILLLISLSALAISQSVKFAIKRERPDVAWRLIARPHTASFPSGHSLHSMAIYGTLALLTARHLRRRTMSALVLVAGFTLPMIIGLSRPYLGVHYPTDVFAGWTAGLACALLALWADQRWGDRPLLAMDLSTPDGAAMPTRHLADQTDAPSTGVRGASDVTGFRGTT